MVRLADLPDWDRKSKLEKVKELTGFDARPWVQPPPLALCRIAIVTTAGLHRRGDRPFGPSATDYRIIPGTPNAGAIQNWFWQGTAAGRVFLALHRQWLASPDKSLQQLCATSLVPKAVLVTLRNL